MTTNERIVKVTQKYKNKMKKKMEGKNLLTQQLMAGTYDIGISIIVELQDVPFHQLTMSTFILCKEGGYDFISKEFEACLELAQANEEKFLFGLHRFYNDLAAKIKREHMLNAYVEFLGMFMHLQYEHSHQGLNQAAITAYIDLILHMQDYLKPDKLDVYHVMVGVFQNGQPLMSDNLYPGLYLPALKHTLDYDPKTNTVPNLEQYYEKYCPLETKKAIGYDFGISNIETHFRQRRIWENMIAGLMPFINEYTYDIAPNQNIMKGDLRPFFLYGMHSHLDTKATLDDLQIRCRTLPTNGITVVFEDEMNLLSQLVMKECIQNDRVYMLFKLTMIDGDLSGYYCPAAKQIFPSISNWNVGTSITKFLQDIIVFCYATAVLNDPKYNISHFGEVFKASYGTISAKAYCSGGVRRNMYEELTGHHDPENNRGMYTRIERDLSKMTQKDSFINGYIRTLPKGQHASPEAKERAIQLGYELDDNETFVSPFVRTIFCLAEDSEKEK